MFLWCVQLRFMGLAFGGKELVNEEDPNLNLRKIHYHLIRDKGLSLVSKRRMTKRGDPSSSRNAAGSAMKNRAAGCHLPSTRQGAQRDGTLVQKRCASSMGSSSMKPAPGFFGVAGTAAN
jgi:hypothetical protein